MNLAATDAHIHLADLLDRDPDFPERISTEILGISNEIPGKSRIAIPKKDGDSRAVHWSQWSCCAASHDESEWERIEALRSRLPPFVSSFGIHPQWAVWKNADFLARLAAEGRIAAIGEAGFDYFGDRPERVRNTENEVAQRAVFDFQLELAGRTGLPLLLHLRKAMDMAFAYAPRLRRLRAVIFHSFSGTPREAESILAKGVNAYFSFGAPILNGNKRAAAACASIPADRVLAETDAPWQQPGGGEFCRAEDLVPIVEGIARIRDVGSEKLSEAIASNFHRAYGT